MSSLNLSLPWIPSVNGNALPMFARLRSIVDSGARPSPRRDAAWTPARLEDALASVPEAKSSILECVLTMWQLRESAPDEEDDGQDDAWRSHVSAWLVRGLRHFSGTGV